MWVALLLNAEVIEKPTDGPPTITIMPTFSSSTCTWYPVQSGTLTNG